MNVLIFLLGYGLCIGTVLLSALGVPETGSFLRQIGQETAVEALGCALLLGLFFLFVRKRVPAVRGYGVPRPSGRVIAIAFLLCPLLCMLQVALLYGDAGNLFVLDTDSSWADVAETFACLPLTAIFGPILEEFSMRVFSITPFATRKGRILAALATTLLFSLLHVSRWQTVLVGSILYSLLLLLSRNIWVPVAFHIAHNLATVLIPGLSGICTLLWPRARYGILGVPLPLVLAMAAMFLLGVLLSVRQLKAMGKEGIRESIQNI